MWNRRELCCSLTSMKKDCSAVGRNGCLGITFWQAKQQTSITFVKELSVQKGVNRLSSSFPKGEFGHLTSNQELTKLQFRMTFCIKDTQSGTIVWVALNVSKIWFNVHWSQWKYLTFYWFHCWIRPYARFITVQKNPFTFEQNLQSSWVFFSRSDLPKLAFQWS